MKRCFIFNIYECALKEIKFLTFMAEFFMKYLK